VTFDISGGWPTSDNLLNTPQDGSHKASSAGATVLMYRGG
jgi:hypothetical protein